jgi:ppGpp synthetase/RelA/SpoT-type nucleotidyltranferase
MSELIPCPIRGCRRKRKPLHVMCYRHWQRVPAAMRKTVWRLFHEARGTDDHLMAVQAACDEVEQQETEANQGPGATS